MSEAKPFILTPEQVAEIRSRYEGFDQGDPECTCVRMDVDFYDTSGCESCDPKSDYNVSRRHAKYMLDIHGAQDIEALCASHEALRPSPATAKRGILNVKFPLSIHAASPSQYSALLRSREDIARDRYRLKAEVARLTSLLAQAEARQ